MVGEALIAFRIHFNMVIYILTSSSVPIYWYCRIGDLGGIGSSTGMGFGTRGVLYLVVSNLTTLHNSLIVTWQ
jgi:hypothetical protein